ncbi:hypothetical protein FACUT_10326 [Fusarium acutatum]|uniref:Uncharacterized protein n=1 Tax=Fusarium acutatum TaxID=78861 RepID=A0A8H4JFF6_9HYPO|nr:hypothetical protein FACUT_10326 [Fusarium acutatum]
MPGSWGAESPSTTKTHEDHERDIEAEKENPQLRLVEDILQRLSELNEKREIAEEKANRLTKKVINMEHRLSYHMALASKAKELAEENLVLREQLDDAQSHIFSRYKIRFPDYDALIEQIQDWVQKLMNPWLEDCDDDARAFLTHAKRRIVDADRFKRILRKYPDLMNGLDFPEADEDIIISVILRYLHVRAFQSLLYDAIPRSVQTISFIENHMRASVEPKRDVNSLPASVGGELHPMPRLTDSLMRLDCKNVLQNRKGFNLRKLYPPPSEEDLYHNLHSVCTVVPALGMRHVGQGNALKSPIVIRKQQILVAWG